MTYGKSEITREGVYFIKFIAMDTDGAVHTDVIDIKMQFGTPLVFTALRSPVDSVYGDLLEDWAQYNGYKLIGWNGPIAE